MIFFKNHAENKAGRLVPGQLLFFKKTIYKVEVSGVQIGFNILQ